MLNSSKYKNTTRVLYKTATALQDHDCIAVSRQKISTVWLCKETSNNKHGWTPVKYYMVPKLFKKYYNEKCTHSTFSMPKCKDYDSN